MMQRLGLDVHVIDQPWGEAADEARLDEVLRADKEKKIKAVCVVHNETSTGVTSDIPFVRKVMNDNNHPALLLVDGVSSIGALEFKYVFVGVAGGVCTSAHIHIHCIHSLSHIHIHVTFFHIFTTTHKDIHIHTPLLLQV